eukprot:scaffold138574_cov27-Tisochrysis_lutea.AAC.3
MYTSPQTASHYITQDAGRRHVRHPVQPYSVQQRGGGQRVGGRSQLLEAAVLVAGGRQQQRPRVGGPGGVLAGAPGLVAFMLACLFLVAPLHVDGPCMWTWLCCGPVVLWLVAPLHVDGPGCTVAYWDAGHGWWQCGSLGWWEPLPVWQGIAVLPVAEWIEVVQQMTMVAVAGPTSAHTCSCSSAACPHLTPVDDA